MRPATDGAGARRLVALVTGVAALVGVGIVASGAGGAGDGEQGVDSAVVEMAPIQTTVPAPAPDAEPVVAAVAPEVGEDGLRDLDGIELTAADECLMDVDVLRLGDSGPGVACLQVALSDAGFYTGSASGEFDRATFEAVNSLQEDRSLFVDGVVGRESAISLGIWPDEESFVERTPPPPPGAVDLLGYTLSYVATSGSDAPPLPEGSGTGKRVVYERQGQRVWAVDGDERVIRSWLVSGSIYANELPGTHYVYSRSERSTAWNGLAELPLMIRWLETQRGHIGFHGIPRKVSDGSRYQTDDELGSRLSGGCQRQADLDAAFLWDFAPEGTKVVVL